MRAPLGPALALSAAILILASAPAVGAQEGGGTTAPDPANEPCPVAYPGDGARKKAIALWMARGAVLRSLPQELPVMAGLAESGLENLRTPGGDYFGFFGMHRALNSGPYRGFPRDPELQLRWFTDRAVLVRQHAIAGGDESFGRDDGGYGLWIADVERPAPENRSGYQRHLNEARGLLDRSCRGTELLADSAPPSLRVRAARRQRGAVTVRVSCPGEPCVAGASATPARQVRRAPAVSVPKGGTTLSLTGRARHAAALTVTVVAVDEEGNAARARRRVHYLPAG